MTEEIQNYRIRTKSEIEEIRKGIIGGAIALCTYSGSEICYGQCNIFEKCWEKDIGSELEKKLDTSQKL